MDEPARVSDDFPLADTRDVDAELANPVVPAIAVRPSPHSHALSPTKRSASMSSISSLDASALVDQTLFQMTSNEMAIANQSFVQVCSPLPPDYCISHLQLEELLKEQEKQMMLVGKVDQMLSAVFAQLRVIHNKHLPAGVTSAMQLVQLYRAVCSLIVTVLSHVHLHNAYCPGFSYASSVRC